MPFPSLQFVGATVRNYRSIGALSMRFQDHKLIAICGANNVGKTSFLRALDIFFSLDPTRFDPKLDIPYHVYEGSRGGGFKSVITGQFRDPATGARFYVTTEFSYDKASGNTLTIRGWSLNPHGPVKKKFSTLDQDQCVEILRGFRFLFIESHNVNIPHVISNIFVHDVLPGLDKLRRRQSEPLKTLKDFFTQSQEAVQKIEKAISAHLHSLLDEVPGLETREWHARVVFPEFDTLREAISGLVNFTLKDSTDRALETKGSGIQRVVLLAVMKYVSETSKEPCIWGIDEPEAFLQPGLQKVLFNQLRKIAESMPVLITTHSPHFVDLENLENTFLFTTTEEEKTYARRPGQVFIKLSTEVSDKVGEEKLEALRVHFGLQRNDAWHVTPHNILVEGEIDKHYLMAMAVRLGVFLPNTFVAGSADKMVGYLEFLGEFCKGMPFKPDVTCLLDHDIGGRPVMDKLSRRQGNSSLPYSLRVQPVFRADGHIGKHLDHEIEDWIYPEIIYRGVNSILKKKGYAKLTDSQWKIRTSKGYYDQPILRFLGEMVKQRNRDRDPLDFESLALKLFLCREVCALIAGVTDQELVGWHMAYPSTRALLDVLAGTSANATAVAGNSN